jgi:hypothetical protein
MAEFNSTEDFLNYRGSEGGGGSRLKSWKEKGYLNWWMACRRSLFSVWYHGFPELVVRKDKQDASKTLKNVWGRNHVCLEDESVLKKQRFRHADGDREHPPQRCSQCFSVEAVRRMVRDGVIKDTDVIFRFDGADNPKENRVIHAGGFAKIWGRNATDATKQRLREHGISLQNVWAEEHVAKLNYVFIGADNDDLAKGLQVAVQNQLVGDKVRKMMNDNIASDGDRGNPLLNPYCIQIFYNEHESKIDEKYGARRMNKFEVTDQILALIRGETPSVERYTKPLDPKMLRAQMEEFSTREFRDAFPWKDVFEKGASTSLPTPQKPVPPSAEEEQRRAAAPPPAKPEPKWGDPCDECKAPMLEGALKCTACGQNYADDGASSPPPAQAASPAASTGTALPVKSDSEIDEANYDDAIPF